MYRDKPDADIETLNGHQRVVVVGRDGNTQYPSMDPDGTVRYDRPEQLSATVKAKAKKLLDQLQTEKDNPEQTRARENLRRPFKPSGSSTADAMDRQQRERDRNKLS